MKVEYSRKTAEKLNVSKYSPVLHTWTKQFIVQVDKLAPTDYSKDIIKFHTSIV